MPYSLELPAPVHTGEVSFRSRVPPIGSGLLQPVLTALWQVRHPCVSRGLELGSFLQNRSRLFPKPDKKSFRKPR
jgi:hypothetical protein